MDVCDVGLGAALMQKDEQVRDCAVAYAIRALHKSKRPYSTPEKECLAEIGHLSISDHTSAQRACTSQFFLTTAVVVTT